MLNADQNDWTLIARYLAGECTLAEAAEIERRLAADPALQAELVELRRLWGQAESLPSGSRIDARWRELSDRMEGAEPVAAAARPALRVLPHHAPPQAWPLRVAGGLAAAVVLVAGGTALWNVGREAPSSVAAGPADRQFATAPGQRAEITLADGSRVQLGVASRMTVRLFDRGRREVGLEGEAVFDVMHDERRPFLVYTANAVTEDLGTRFGVRAYPGDSDVQVVVVEGKVSLRPAGQSRGDGDSAGVLLGANDLGLLGADGRSTVRQVDPARYLAWTAGRLVFRLATLREVGVQLGRWYGVSIEIPSESLAVKRVTLDMPAQALSNVLDAVTVPLNIRYTATARAVVLHP